MGRPRNAVPKYLHHKLSGQARIRVAGTDVYLGDYGSAASKAEYRRICRLIESGIDLSLVNNTPRVGLTIAEMVAAFWVHAKKHYRNEDGEPTSEIGWLADSLKLLVEMHPDMPAQDFGPTLLKALRVSWIKMGICRNSVNARTNRVRRVFKWAASEEMIPFSVYQALTTVDGLRAGRSDARETNPVGPVLDLHVACAIPFLRPTVRVMVLVQRLTGARPGEIRKMKAKEVDRSRSPWVYTPSLHKTKYRGRPRRSDWARGAANPWPHARRSLPE